jgi:hypothetical protein
MKKFTLLLISLLSTASAFAGVPEPQTINAARALIHNPEILKALAEKGADQMIDYRESNLGPSQFKFAMTFETTPVSTQGPALDATVSVLETLDHSGELTYSATVEYSTPKPDSTMDFPPPPPGPPAHILKP